MLIVTKRVMGLEGCGYLMAREIGMELDTCTRTPILLINSVCLCFKAPASLHNLSQFKGYSGIPLIRSLICRNNLASLPGHLSGIGKRINWPYKRRGVG